MLFSIINNIIISSSSRTVHELINMPSSGICWVFHLRARIVLILIFVYLETIFLPESNVNLNEFSK